MEIKKWDFKSHFSALFKIDLIVWKFNIINNAFLIFVQFKIDLIVWK